MNASPELMSPAGYWPQLRAAIESGADAVYFGLRHFSARAKVGFGLAELPEVMKTLHVRGVKGFVTLNTLVFDDEFESFEEAIIAIANAGVDAVIVQDTGACELIRKIAPELEIHGSTQMSITSAQGAELAQSLGCSRVVLGRELSLTDIRKIADSTDVELEVFVHGALCVSYSGQCFSSEAWGGRSANRGKCAQACRLSYDLIVDGEPRDLGPYRYLLSPGDLSTIELVPELIDIGISCLKIEGRYKDSEYVALTTRAYREAIDLAMLGVPNEVTADEKRDLEQIYSRGLGSHFMSGTNHQKVVIGRAPRHRGLLVGKVLEVSRSSVVVQPEHPIKRGDGIVFDAADWRSPDEPEEGGHVYEVRHRDDNSMELEFGRGDVDFNRIRIGDLVWRTNDPALNKKLKSLTKTEKPVVTRPIFFSVSAEGGLPLSVTAKLESGHEATFTGEHALEPAKKRALDLEMLESKLGRLGGTAFHLGEIEFLTSDPVFVPTSVLNEARRELVGKLLKQKGNVKSIPATAQLKTEYDSFSKRKLEYSSSQSPSAGDVHLHLLVRKGDQLDAAIELASKQKVASITLDYLELYGLRPSVEKIRAAGIVPRVASPRMLKPAEQKIIRFLLSLDCEILIRSGGLLFDLVQEREKTQVDNSSKSFPKLIGDFSLNAANALSAWKYLDLGLERVTPTYDLNSKQISGLTHRFPAAALEVIAYSHLPVFHTEHCVFCRFLSDGTDNTNCGHPCEKHEIAVRDSQGRAHPIMADVGCRNTVFGAEAQTAPEALERWRESGISHFRLEFVHQSAEEVEGVASSFSRFFREESSLDELEVALERYSPQQTTSGSLFVPTSSSKLIQLG